MRERFVKKQKRIFITYSRSDKEIVRDFADNLRDSGINAFIEDRSIDYGKTSVLFILNGMQNSELNIVFLSKNYMESDFVQKELLVRPNCFAKENTKWIFVKLDNTDSSDMKMEVANVEDFEWRENPEEFQRFVEEKLSS